MDAEYVMKCEQIIRDDMIKYHTSLKAISSIVNDTDIELLDRIRAIKQICRLNITPVSSK